MRALVLALLLALPACAQVDGPSYTGVDVRDVATRHYYNPFDGLLLDRNPYPPELVEDAETLVTFLSAGTGEGLAVGRVSSVRVMAWQPGQLDVLAIGMDGGRPHYRRALFLTEAKAFKDARDVKLDHPSLTVSLKDLTLALRSADGAFALVDPVGAGGYRDESRGVLMTPAMRPEVTRTPGRRRKPGYMMKSRSKPDYYEGLPFVRLHRADQHVDEYALHGPISRSGTFPLPPLTAGEALQKVKNLAYKYKKDPEGLSDELIEQKLVDLETRLVRGRISNGCIRLRARDIRELYPVLDALPDGAPVTITYRPDPLGASHPFPWETRLFAIATDEKDEDGLTVMFTGEMKNRPGLGREKLPFPSDQDLAEIEPGATAP